MNAIKYINLSRPKIKWCYWCKNYKLCMLDLMVMTTRQHKKCIREQEFRYCRKYRFSKKRFYNWKDECRNHEEVIQNGRK